MAKLNTRTYRDNRIEQNLIEHPDATVNFEGAIAFTNTSEVQLYKMVCTSLFGEDKFYQSAKSHDKDLLNTITSVQDTKYILQLASYVRNEMYLRTVPVVLLAEVAHRPDSKVPDCAVNERSLVREYCSKVLKRSDDCTELLAYWLAKYGKPVPNAVKRGIMDVLSNFDAYQLAKYKADDKPVKLRDVVKLCARPLIKEERFKKLVEGELKSEGTWEATISSKGNNKESWLEILPRMGIMAVLRNLRNMLQAGVPVEQITSKFTDEVIINSKQLPFRWYSAYKALHVPDINLFSRNDILDVLEDAMLTSCKNIKQLPGTTLIAIDHSGSMNTSLSERGTVTYFDTAAVLGAISKHICEKSAVALFGSSHKFVRLNRDSLLANVQLMKDTDVGHATYAHLVIEDMVKSRQKADRIIILTDEQVYNAKGFKRIIRAPSHTLAGQLIKYKNSINRDVKTYVIDLAGYEHSCVPEDEHGVTQVAGWSSRVLDFIHANEADGQQVVQMIKDNY